MRNLKRALSLGLASAMVLGTMTFGTNAATFNDIDQVKNEKAVELVAQIGLMMGDDEGNFNPSEVVNRAEMAVICTTMLHGANFHVSQFVEVDAFTDVPAWAADYVNLAASLGIVEGRGDGTFDPNATVTTAEAMTMILRTLGYLQNSSEFGDNWALNVTRKGTELGLYNEDEDGVLSANEGLTRENVASLAFRALTEVVQVDYNPTFQAYYNYGSSMVDGVNNNVTEDTLGYKNFQKLFAYDSYDAHDRPAVTWMHNGQEIGTYAVTADFTFTEQVTVKEIYNSIGGTILNSEDYNRGIYIDGELLAGNYKSEEFNTVDDTKTSIVISSNTSTVDGMLEVLSSNDTTPFLESGAGVLTQVYLIAPEYDSSKNITKKGEVIISMVHTYLAEVTYVTDNGDDNTVGIRYITKDETAVTQNAWVDSSFEYSVDTVKTFEKADLVMVTVAENAKGDMEIVTIDKPSTVEGTATGSRIEPSVVGGSWVEIDGEQYDYALSVRGNIDDDTAMAPVESTQIVAFFDDYGYVLGYSAAVEGVKYLYVEDKDESALMGGSRIRATLADGSEQIITVTYIDDTPVSASNWAGIPSTSIFTDTNGDQATANENVRNSYNTLNDGSGDKEFGVQLENRIYGYVELSDGTYKLTTAIRKEYNTNGSSTGVLPGINVDGNDYTYTTTANNIYGLMEETNGSILNTPQEDSMFIFTSVHYDRPTDEKSDWDYEKRIVTANYSTRVDANSGDFKTIYNKINGTDTHYAFRIQAGYAGVLAAPVSKSLPNNPEAHETTGEEYYDLSSSSSTSASNHVFLVDTQTVYVDVVNNVIWNGYDDDKLSNMTGGDVNMQVVFGKGGIADVIYINHGAPTVDGDGYFIVTDNQADWKLVDGINTYTYTVWIDGVAEQLVVKDHELTDQNGHKLNNNDLYRIESADDDYVYRVTRLYEYDHFANTAYSEYYSESNPFQSPVSAVKYAAYGTMIMAQAEVMDQGGQNSTTEFNEDSTNTGDDNHDWVFDIGSGHAEDAFSYDDSTTFIVLTANGSTSKDNSAKYSVRVGDVTDIQVIDQSYVDPTWVDVIEASNNADSSTPYAETVVIIQPYVTSESFYSSFTYHIEAHDTYLEPTLGMTADEQEIANWLAWKDGTLSTTLANTYGYDSSANQWNWQKKAFYSDGTTMEKAFVLEGWVDTGTRDMSDYDQSLLAKEIMLHFATDLRGINNPVISEFVTGGNSSGALYGSWNARIDGVDAVTGDAVYTYLRVPFSQELQQGVGYYGYTDITELGVGAVYVDWTGRTYDSYLGNTLFSDEYAPYLTGSLNVTTNMIEFFRNETSLAYGLFRAWADDLVSASKKNSGAFDYIHVVMTNNNTSSASTFSNFAKEGEYTATFYYYKDGKLVNTAITGVESTYKLDLTTGTQGKTEFLLLDATSGTVVTPVPDESTGYDADVWKTEEAVVVNGNGVYGLTADTRIVLEGAAPAHYADEYTDEELAKILFLRYVEKTLSGKNATIYSISETEENLNDELYEGVVKYETSTGETKYCYLSVNFVDLRDDTQPDDYGYLDDFNNSETDGYFTIYDIPRPEDAYLATDGVGHDYLNGASLEQILGQDYSDDSSIDVVGEVTDNFSGQIKLTGSIYKSELKDTVTDEELAKNVVNAYMQKAYSSNYTVGGAVSDGSNTDGYWFKVVVFNRTTLINTDIDVYVPVSEAVKDDETTFTIVTGEEVEYAASFSYAGYRSNPITELTGVSIDANGTTVVSGDSTENDSLAKEVTKVSDDTYAVHELTVDVEIVSDYVESAATLAKSVIDQVANAAVATGSAAGAEYTVVTGDVTNSSKAERSVSGSSFHGTYYSLVKFTNDASGEFFYVEYKLTLDDANLTVAANTKDADDTAIARAETILAAEASDGYRVVSGATVGGLLVDLTALVGSTGVTLAVVGMESTDEFEGDSWIFVTINKGQGDEAEVMMKILVSDVRNISNEPYVLTPNSTSITVKAGEQAGIPLNFSFTDEDGKLTVSDIEVTFEISDVGDGAMRSTGATLSADGKTLLFNNLTAGAKVTVKGEITKIKGESVTGGPVLELTFAVISANTVDAAGVVVLKGLDTTKIETDGLKATFDSVENVTVSDAMMTTANDGTVGAGAVMKVEFANDVTDEVKAVIYEAAAVTGATAIAGSMDVPGYDFIGLESGSAQKASTIATTNNYTFVAVYINNAGDMVVITIFISFDTNTNLEEQLPGDKVTDPAVLADISILNTRAEEIKVYKVGVDVALWIPAMKAAYSITSDVFVYNEANETRYETEHAMNGTYVLRVGKDEVSDETNVTITVASGG